MTGEFGKGTERYREFKYRLKELCNISGLGGSGEIVKQSSEGKGVRLEDFYVIKGWRPCRRNTIIRGREETDHTYNCILCIMFKSPYLCKSVTYF